MKETLFEDQRSATDDNFLNHLRLPGASGRALSTARSRGERSAITRIVASHFRTRSAPRWVFYMHGTPWPEINGRGSVLQKADALLSRNELKGSWPPFQTLSLNGGSGADWDNALQQLGGTVSRNVYVAELSTAFALTGKVEYLKKAQALIRGFVEAFPFVLEEGAREDHDRYFGSGPNNSGDTAGKLLRWMDVLHAGALHVPGVYSDEELFWLIKQIWFYSVQYERFVGDVMRRDNHHLSDHGKYPFFLGLMFPEFSNARELLKQGRDTILFHFEQNCYKDGSYAEHCTKYQYHIFYNFAFVHALARANGFKLLNAAQQTRLAKWAEFLARATKPDGILSEFGDEFGGSMAHFACSLAAPVMHPPLAAQLRALGYEPGELVSESPASLARRLKDWKPGSAPRIGLSPWFTAERTPAAPSASALPKPATIQYPHGGFSFFRGDWTREADFLGVAHYTDSLPHSHTHWDMLSFVLHTQGQTLIGDPATWLYTDPRRQSQETRGYLYAADSHNCLIMDDDTLKPLKALGHPCNWGNYPPKHGLGLFQAGGAIEVLEAWHDAYAPTRHRRFVAHVRGVGFVFVDLLARKQLDLRPHQYSQRFHFEGDVVITPETPEPLVSIRAERNGAQCLIIPGRESHATWQTWHDERVAGVYGVPSEKVRGGPWVAELTRRIQGPSVFTTFLLTGAAQGAGTAEYLGAKPAQHMYQQHDGFSAHALPLGEMGTLFVASCPYGRALNHERFATDAELAIAHVTAAGKVQSWAMARGSGLEVNGKKLASGRRKDWRAM